VLVTPSGWAFGIWGPIFILEGVAVYRQWTGEAPAWDATVYKAWCAACGLQSMWAFAFAFEALPLSAVLISGISVSTGVAYATMTEAPVTLGNLSMSSVSALLLNGTLGFGTYVRLMILLMMSFCQWNLFLLDIKRLIFKFNLRALERSNWVFCWP
jgi:hypothetical protein